MQLRELAEVKKRMQGDADDLRAQLSEAKSETSSESSFPRLSLHSLTVCADVRRQLQKRLQEDELSASTSTAAQSGSSTVIIEV